jgi:hypothetical protein
VDGKNEHAHGFQLSAYSSIFLHYAVAYVKQIKMFVAMEGLIIIIQKRPGGGSATVRGEMRSGLIHGTAFRSLTIAINTNEVSHNAKDNARQS